MILTDSVPTMPGATVEEKHERLIAAIDTVIAVYDAEEEVPQIAPQNTLLNVGYRPPRRSVFLNSSYYRTPTASKFSYNVCSPLCSVPGCGG